MARTCPSTASLPTCTRHRHGIRPASKLSTPGRVGGQRRCTGGLDDLGVDGVGEDGVLGLMTPPSELRPRILAPDGRTRSADEAMSVSCDKSCDISWPIGVIHGQSRSLTDFDLVVARTTKPQVTGS